MLYLWYEYRYCAVKVTGLFSAGIAYKSDEAVKWVFIWTTSLVPTL